MGWGSMFLLGNIGQQIDIEDQKKELEDLKQQINCMHTTGTNSGIEDRIAQLQKENDELRLYLTALINYLGNKGVIESREFRRLVETIDAEDGSTDGGYQGAVLR